VAKNVLLLSDLIRRADMLELACDRCGRRGWLPVARLARNYARETLLGTIMWAQVGDCPNRNARQERERRDSLQSGAVAAARRPLSWQIVVDRFNAPDESYRLSKNVASPITTMIVTMIVTTALPIQ
jgi:hypothetical protein